MRCFGSAILLALSILLPVTLSSAQQAEISAAPFGTTGQFSAAASPAPFAFGSHLLATPAESRADQGIVFFGLEQTPLGKATLTVSGQTLVVGNIGTGGGDGVLATLEPNSTYWDANFNSLGSPKSYPPGSFFQVQNIGTINGAPNQTLATGVATDLGSQWGLSFNFSPVSSSTLLVQYSLKGTLVGSETVKPSPERMIVPTFTDAGIDWGTDKDGNLLFVSVFFSWSSAVAVRTPSGRLAVIDHVEVSPTAFNAAVSGPSGGSLTASGIPTFTLTSEPFLVNNGGPTLFSDLDDPITAYQCCFGALISGSKASGGGASSTVGNAFTLQNDATVGQIDVAVGSSSGVNAFTVGIYSDSGGAPGTPLVELTDLASSTTYGSCCGLITVTGFSLPVTAGTQYWLVVGPATLTSTTVGGWNSNDTGVSGSVSVNNGSGWTTTQQTLNAFDILGAGPQRKR